MRVVDGADSVLDVRKELVLITNSSWCVDARSRDVLLSDRCHCRVHFMHRLTECVSAVLPYFLPVSIALSGHDIQTDH